MYRSNIKRYNYGFALPAVLISSVILFGVLAVAVSSVSSVRIALKEQYYGQLAKNAGEAGVEYAKACLTKSSNVPLWSDDNPLTPATDCLGQLPSGVSCPGHETCSVYAGEGLRTSFRVNRPMVDAQGRAVAIPNAGYTDLTRTSDGSVWRRFTQPAVQPVSAPNLCRVNSPSSLGWRNASLSSSQDSLPGVSSAMSIGAAANNVLPGYTYFRKEIAVPEAGNYVVRVHTPLQDGAQVYVNKTLRVSSDGQVASSSAFSLSAGCHTIEVRLENKNLTPRASRFTAAIMKSGATDGNIITDDSWRVNTGNTVGFSEAGYYTNAVGWDTPTVGAVQAVWAADTTTGSATAPRITPLFGSNASGQLPGSVWTYLRKDGGFTVSGSVDVSVRISAQCDDSCVVYIDGSPVMTSFGSSRIGQAEVTLSSGRHDIGIALLNTGTTLNPSNLTVAVTQVNAAGVLGTVLTRSDSTWRSAKINSSSEESLTSYDTTFKPSPWLNETSEPIPTSEPGILSAVYAGGYINIAISGRPYNINNGVLWDEALLACWGSASCRPVALAEAGAGTLPGYAWLGFPQADTAFSPPITGGYVRLQVVEYLTVYDVPTGHNVVTVWIP